MTSACGTCVGSIDCQGLSSSGGGAMRDLPDRPCKCRQVIDFFGFLRSHLSILIIISPVTQRQRDDGIKVDKCKFRYTCYGDKQAKYKWI